jgi:hypothetical protein
MEEMNVMAEQASVPVQQPRPQHSLVERARRGDHSAIVTMLSPFLSENEHVLLAQYLGIDGMWGLGVSSFAAVTDQRVVALRVHPFGAVVYQDGALEHLNGGVVIQPSRVGLYATIILLALLTLGVSLLATPWIARLYYRFKKSGVVVWVREGVSVYMFCDRRRFRQAASIYRAASQARVARLLTLSRAIGSHVPPGIIA